MITPNTAVPWHLIGELFSQGKSIEYLAQRFNIPPKAIQKRLDVALSSSGYVRSNAEINHCSNKVKSDLISALVKMSSELAESADPNDKNSLLKLERLTNIAARIFSWPSAKAVDITAQAISANPSGQAINLELMKRPPDSLTDAA